MNLERFNIDRCHLCQSNENITPYLIEWSVSRPDILSFCNEGTCKHRFSTSHDTARLTKLTLEEAKVLIVKSNL
jgi:hypothetical protein